MSRFLRFLPCDSKFSTSLAAAAVFAAVTIAAQPGLAHHFMDGQATWTHELAFLSGLAHPLVEWPALLAMAAVSLVAYSAARPAFTLLSFLISVQVGCVAQWVWGASGPEALLVGGALLAVGAVLLGRASTPRPLTLGGLVLAGTLFGHVFAADFTGPEVTMLPTYLVGLMFSQLACTALLITAAGRLSRSGGAWMLSLERGVGACALVCAAALQLVG